MTHRQTAVSTAIAVQETDVAAGRGVMHALMLASVVWIGLGCVAIYLR